MNTVKNLNDIITLLWGRGGQAELARLSNISVRQVRNYMTGESRIPVRIWAILAEQCQSRKGDIEGAQWIIEAQLNAIGKEKESA